MLKRADPEAARRPPSTPGLSRCSRVLSAASLRARHCSYFIHHLTVTEARRGGRPHSSSETLAFLRRQFLPAPDIAAFAHPTSAGKSPEQHSAKQEQR